MMFIKSVGDMLINVKLIIKEQETSKNNEIFLKKILVHLLIEN